MTGNKRQRQDIEDETEGKRNKGEGEGIFSQEGESSLWREEIDMPHRQMAVYKWKREVLPQDELVHFY